MWDDNQGKPKVFVYGKSASPVDASTMELIPGKTPKTANGKLAVEAAWELERELKRRATNKEVMSRLMEWARKGTKPDVLKSVGADNRSVQWMTDKGKENNYSMKALEKTLETWNKSRA